MQSELLRVEYVCKGATFALIHGLTIGCGDVGLVIWFIGNDFVCRTKSTLKILGPNHQ